MPADVIDIEKWHFDRLVSKYKHLTDATLRAMSREALDEMMRDLERHVKVKAE